MNKVLRRVTNGYCPCGDPVGGPPCSPDAPCPYGVDMPAGRWGRIHPAYRDDLRRLALLVLWLAPRDILAAHLRALADKIET